VVAGWQDGGGEITHRASLSRSRIALRDASSGGRGMMKKVKPSIFVIDKGHIVCLCSVAAWRGVVALVLQALLEAGICHYGRLKTIRAGGSFMT